MEKIRSLIVDDEQLARLRIRKLLENEPDIEIAGECADGAHALASIEQLDPHLVFLDIQMGDIGGFEMIDRLGDLTRPVFIFITAYDKYAVRAFEENAIDYLLKPFSEDRFRTALQRSRERIHARQIKTYTDQLLSLLHAYHDDRKLSPPAPAPVTASYSNRLVLKTGSRLVFVDADQVDWVEAEGVYVRLYSGQKSHLLRESLTNVEQRLDPTRFVRIHRSTLVNVHRIKEIIPHLNGGCIVILHDGKRLKMSRSYRDRVNATLG